MQLKAVGLQLLEEEGGEREHEPSQGIRSEEDDVAGPQVSERNDTTPYPPIVP
jgi:hypothetical protein